MTKEGVTKEAVALCLAVYRVTDKFPQNEILRHKLRKLSIDIVERLVYIYIAPHPTVDSRFFNIEELKKKFYALFACLHLADKQEWVHSKNFEVLRREYRHLYRDSCQAATYTKREKTRVKKTGRAHTPPNLTKQQTEIIKFLENEEDGAAIPIIAEAIGRSIRTVVREMKVLMENGSVVRRGKTRSVKFFSIRNGVNMALND